MIAGEKEVYRQHLVKSPLYLMLEPTTKCNLNCQMCVHNELTDFGDMDYSLFEKVMDQLPEVKTIKFQGLGETFLAKNAIRMLEYCKARGIDVISITQCIWRGIDIPYLMTLISHMYISYHAADERTYKEICGGGDWKLLHDNISMIVDNKGGSDVIFNCVLSGLNYEQAPLIIKNAAEYKVKHVRFQIMQNWTTKEDDKHEDYDAIKTINSDILVDILRKTYKVAKEMGVSVELVGNDKFEYTHCIWPFERVFITREGLVMPCHMRPLPENCVGDLKTQSFDEIWNNEQYLTMRELLASNRPPRMCEDCPYIASAQELSAIKALL